MQLYALDASNKLVFARNAVKQIDYFCLECKGVVHLRGGVHRQKHFYHRHPSQDCRQSGKSMEHLQVQFHLQSILPTGESTLEHRFPEIRRIADVLWEPMKLIFEIQCSAISSVEVKARNADYASQGYQVIWVLHDSMYNQWRLTAAENALYEAPHYFTNIDAEGAGIIYDHFALRHHGLRKKIIPPLTVDLSQSKNLIEQSNLKLPLSIHNQRKNWPLCFVGDLIERILSDRDHPEIMEYLEKIELAEQHFTGETNRRDLGWTDSMKYFLEKWVLRPYLLGFQIILEKFCR
jgi:competence protein CoiA